MTNVSARPPARYAPQICGVWAGVNAPSTVLDHFLPLRPRKRVERVVMNGPGGIGFAEVAVSELPPGDRDSPGGKGTGGGGGRSPSAAAQRVLAGGRAALAAVGGLLGGGPPQGGGKGGGKDEAAAFRCALMQLSLPVGHVADAILKALVTSIDA